MQQLKNHVRDSFENSVSKFVIKPTTTLLIDLPQEQISVHAVSRVTQNLR